MYLSSEDRVWSLNTLVDAYYTGDCPDDATVWDYITRAQINDPDTAQAIMDIAGDICERRYMRAKADHLRAQLTAAGCPDAAAAVTDANADDWVCYLVTLIERGGRDVTVFPQGVFDNLKGAER